MGIADYGAGIIPKKTANVAVAAHRTGAVRIAYGALAPRPNQTTDVDPDSGCRNRAGAVRIADDAPELAPAYQTANVASIPAARHFADAVAIGKAGINARLIVSHKAADVAVVSVARHIARRMAVGDHDRSTVPRLPQQTSDICKGFVARHFTATGAIADRQCSTTGRSAHQAADDMSAHSPGAVGIADRCTIIGQIPYKAA